MAHKAGVTVNAIKLEATTAAMSLPDGEKIWLFMRGRTGLAELLP